MENAQKFFDACETCGGWEKCAEYVAGDDATFAAQSEPIAELKTVKEYVEWMKGFGTGVVPGCSYTVHARAFDADTRTALFFATFRGTHTGAGGPVEATGKSVEAHYVYSITMNDDGKVVNMVKVWNAPWSMKQLGWM